ncbi:MAG: hypothetical protein ABIB61_00575 [Candidatus Shapirobacteria bacterium]
MERSKKSGEENEPSIGSLSPEAIEKIFEVADRCRRDSDFNALYETLREEGSCWSKRRRDCGLSRSDVAKRLGIEREKLLLFEGGFLSPEEMPPDFLSQLAGILGLN